MLVKARADLSAARLLAGHAEQDDGVVGFHAQQACEKALKAVIAIREVEIPRIHDLEALVELLGGAGVDLPDDLGEIGSLTAWAVTMRYDEPDASLDRDAAVATAAAAVEWAETLVEQ